MNRAERLAAVVRGLKLPTDLVIEGYSEGFVAGYNNAIDQVAALILEHPPEDMRIRRALEKLLRAEEKFVRDTCLPQPDDFIQDAVNEARLLLGWPPVASGAGEIVIVDGHGNLYDGDGRVMPVPPITQRAGADASDARQREFARKLSEVENPPTDTTTALGHLMRQWLLGTIADPGTGVDTGGGMGCYDLWVKVGGEDIAITLKSRESA
jgi:hypothetical protein